MQLLTHTCVHTHTHTCTHTYMITDTVHNHDAGHILRVFRVTHSHVWMYPWGGATASVAAWCFISRTTHYYSNTLPFKCYNVSVNTAKSTLYAPRGQTVYKHTCVMKKWNDLWVNPLHDHIFYAHLMCFLRISVWPYTHFLRQCSRCFCFMKQYQ